MLRGVLIVGIGVGVLTSAAAAGPRFVLVPRATDLHTAPRADAPSAHDPVAVDANADEDDFWVFRKVRDVAGGWVEVATGAPMTDDPEAERPRGGTFQCYGAPTTDTLELHLFVRASELAAVTTRPVAVRFPDGTSVRLGVGVAVGPAMPGGTRRVMVDGLRFAIPIPADHVGTSYVADRRVLLRVQRTPEVAGDAAGLVLDGQQRAIDKKRSLLPLYIEKRSGRLVDVNGTCVAFRAWLDGMATQADDQTPWASLTGTGGWPASVKRGATAYWPDGSVAGHAPVDAQLDTEIDSRDHGRRCFGVGLRDDQPEGRLTVCFRTRDLLPGDLAPGIDPHSSGFGGIGASPGGYVPPRGRLTIDPANIAITGDQKPEAVALALRRHKDELRSCYGKSPVPSPTGTLVARLDVAASGTVAHVAIVHGLEADIDGCVTDLLDTLQLPAGRATVTVPLSFAP